MCVCCLREFLFILCNGDFHRSMQRDNLRKRENDKTAVKAGISPSPFGFPSAHPFPTPSPLLPAFAFYYSAEVCGLKAELLRYGKGDFLKRIFVIMSKYGLKIVDSIGYL